MSFQTFISLAFIAFAVGLLAGFSMMREQVQIGAFTIDNTVYQCRAIDLSRVQP